MFCPLCGHLNTDSAHYCVSCGKPLQSSSGDMAQRAQSEQLPDAAQASVSANRQPPDRIYATFWRRFLAFFIDMSIIEALYLAALFIFARDSFSQMFDLDSIDAMSGAVIAVWLVSLLAMMLYYVLMETSSKQATLGKMAVGIKVTDESGKRITLGRALGRFFAHFVSYTIFLIGFVMNAFTKRQQTLHDLIAGTLVVYREVTPEDVAAHPERPADTVQKVTSVTALVLLFSSYFAMIAIFITMSFNDIDSHLEDPDEEESTISANVVFSELIGEEATEYIDEYFETHQKFPALLEETGFENTSEEVKSVRFDSNNGQITVELAFSPLEGKTLVFYPEEDEDNGRLWKCYSEEIEERYLYDCTSRY